MRAFIFLTTAALVHASGGAFAATMEQLKTIDTNRNGALDAGPEFRAYLKLEKLDGSEPLTARQRAGIGALQVDLADRGNIPFSEIAVQKELKVSNCDKQQGLYIRRDKIDISIYSNPIGKQQAKGAAVSYTNDSIGKSQTGEVHGVASYVFARSPCASPSSARERRNPFISGYAFAVSASGDGTLKINRQNEKSALKVSLDAQIELSNLPVFDLNVLTGSAYYQTDFRGLANAYGFSGSWEPFLPLARLGGSVPGSLPTDNLLDFYIQAKAEAYALHVDRIGLTNLTRSDYAWVGGTARLNTFPLAQALQSQLSFITSYQWYWDERSRRTVDLFIASLAYNFTEDGSTSIALEYQKGTDRDTLDRRNQYMVTLNYKN